MSSDDASLGEHRATTTPLLDVEPGDVEIEASASPERLLGARQRAHSAILVGVAVAAANGLNVLFHFAVARIVSPSEYSLVATLFALLLVVTVPTVALQAAVARETAARVAAGDDAGAGAILREAARGVGRIVIAVMVLVAVLAWPLAIVLNVERPLPAIATATAFAMALTLPVVQGALQGTERFMAFGASQVSYATLKFAAGIALALAGFGAAGIMFGVAGAAAITAVVSLLPLRRLLAKARDRPRQPGRIVGSYLGAASISLSLLMALTSFDLIVSRIVFSAHTSGAYAAASVGARTLLVLPIAVTTVLFPRVATLADRERERRHLLAGVGAVAGLAAIAVAVAWAIPETLLKLAFGADYTEATPWLGPLSLAMGLYAVVNVYLFHFLALARSRYLLVLVVVFAGQLVAYALLHEAPLQLVWVQVVTAAVLLVASEAFDRLRRAPAPEASPA